MNHAKHPLWRAEPRKGPGEAAAKASLTRPLTGLGSPGHPLWRAEPRKGPGEAAAKASLTRRLTPLRLANLETLKGKFRADSGQLDVVEPAMAYQSHFACAVCHAR